MKTVLQKCIVICLGLSISLFLFTAFKAENPKEDFFKKVALIATPTPEDSIDFKQHVVNQPDGYQQLRACMDSVSVGCTVKIDKYVEIIDSIHFRVLLDTVKLKAAKYPGRRIYALKFIYGLDANKDMKLVYQPVLLKRDSHDTVRVNAEYNADSCYSYFTYNSKKGFEIVTPAYVQDLAQRYTNSIKFLMEIKNGHKTCRSFNYATNETGDVRRVVYSFQEIYALLNGHKATQLYIMSATKNMPVDGKDYLKHLMLLGSENLNLIKFREEIFFQKFGNLSHLCPPSCSVHKFNLKK